MRSFWTRRRAAAVPLCLFLIYTFPLLAQKGGSPGTTANAGSAGSAASIGSPSRGTVNNNPNLGVGNTQTTSPGSMQTIFLSGTVMFDDGARASTDIRIERVCGGSTRLESHTDSKGHFSFQVGQNPVAFSDASDSSVGMMGPGGTTANSSAGFGNSMQTSQLNALWNCELRAAFPGYRSDVIDLSTRHPLDSPDVGTIVLHRLGNVQGSTISMTTELAPKPAQKAYHKGLKALQAGNGDEAEKDFQKATDIYPKYALAWFALGQMQQKAAQPDLAGKSYLTAAQADNKYLSPYDRLAYLSAQQGKWEETADYSKHVIELNPVEFPTSFWYNALANFNLRKPALAEQSDADLLKLDTQHNFPQAEYLMAQLMLDKSKYPEAALHLRAYLKLQPNAKDADALKATLTKLEQANAQVKSPMPPQ
ncbi:MAG TPA: hypothetical protein VH302_04555 [Bryobacteraceae bacterium]|jgi:tetratricopeptide (TPR) repeat protein|nr:hypothetical protein [Bryobacteraceae bacterium]